MKDCIAGDYIENHHMIIVTGQYVTMVLTLPSDSGSVNSVSSDSVSCDLVSATRDILPKTDAVFIKIHNHELPKNVFFQCIIF